MPIEVRQTEIIAQHDVVLQALRVRDEAAARAALVADLTVGGERILTELRKQRQAESRLRAVDIGRAGQA